MRSLAARLRDRDRSERRKARSGKRANHKAKQRASLRARGLPTDTSKAQPNLYGATPLELNAPDVLERVADLAAASVPHTLIAKKCGMTLPAFKKHLEKHPEFQAALDEGHAREELWAVSRLRQMAEGEGRNAAIATLAILNSRHGWRGEQRGPPQVVINLPGPQSHEEYARLVNAPLIEHK
jgi:hypothetical protein